jgi:activator of HSP90 ATPase
MKPNTTIIQQKTTIPATPEQVYEAYTNPKKHTEFTGSKATGKPTPGTKFTAWDQYIFGTYLELQKPNKIIQEWQTTDWPENYPPSKLELTLKPTPEGTEITLTQTNIPTQQKNELTEGWQEFYWKPLKKHFKKPKPPTPKTKKQT